MYVAFKLNEGCVGLQALAYLKLASKRFADTVPMSITSELLDKLPDALYAMLQDELLQNDGTRIKDLMQENPGITRKREALRSTLVILDDACSRLSSF
jgi:hypothetical protein